MGNTHNEIFSGKKQLWLLCPKKVDLTHSELLVYSYCAWQDTWKEKPAILKTVKATGLSRNTVRTADRHLQQRGLLGSDHAVPEPPEGAFAAANRDGDHWFKKLQYWVCYVRRPDAALTHIQTALLSFMWHCHCTNFHPHFSCAYLGAVLCVHRETIADALRALEARGLLTYTTHERGITFTLRQLIDVSFLQDAVQQRSTNGAQSVRTVKHAQSVVVSEEVAPTRAVMPPGYSRTGESMLAGTITRDKLAARLRRSIPDDAEQLATELVSTRAYNGEDRWGWFLEFDRMVNDHERDPGRLISRLRHSIHAEWNGATR